MIEYIHRKEVFMKALEAIKTYLTLGEEAYNVLKRWKDEALQGKIIEIFSSESFKKLDDSNKKETYKVLSIEATREDKLEQSTLLDNVFKLVKDKNLNHGYYFANCLDLICENPAFDVTTAYDLEKNPDMDSEKIYRVVTFAAMGIPQNCYFEAKKWDKKYHKIILIFDTRAFRNLSDDMKERFYLKLKEIRMSNEYKSNEKETILDEIYDFWSRVPEGIDEAKFLGYFNIILDYPMLGDAVWSIMNEADDAEKTIDDVRKWIDIYTELYVKECADPCDFYYIVFNNKLAAHGILDLIVNNIFASKLSKSDLFGDIAYLLNNLDFNTAINVILALFKMPSQKHYDIIGSILGHDEVLFSNQLLAFIDRVIKTPEDKLDKLKQDIEYEVIYQEMPFSKAAVEHNSEAMDYLDSHPGIKSTSLVRIPIWQKRNKYKI